MSEIVQIKPRWQVTIPKAFREALALKERAYLSFEMRDSTLVVRPVRTAKVIGSPQPASGLKALSGVLSVGGNAIEDEKKLYR